MKFFTGFLFLLIVLPRSLNGQIPDSIKYQSLEPHDFQLQYLMTDSSILIDVREPFEFKGNRISNALNIPSSGNLERVADTLKREYSYFLYCTGGYRSSRVAATLYSKGFRKLFNLEGGIVGWKKKGMPVVKGKGRRAKGAGSGTVKISEHSSLLSG